MNGMRNTWKGLRKELASSILPLNDESPNAMLRLSKSVNSLTATTEVSEFHHLLILPSILYRTLSEFRSYIGRCPCEKLDNCRNDTLRGWLNTTLGKPIGCVLRGTLVTPVERMHIVSDSLRGLVKRRILRRRFQSELVLGIQFLGADLLSQKPRLCCEGRR